MRKEIELRPSCEICGVFFELRTGRSTAEQDWCGVWYDHPNAGLNCGGSRASFLYPSAALRAEYSKVELAL